MLPILSRRNFHRGATAIAAAITLGTLSSCSIERSEPSSDDLIIDEILQEKRELINLTLAAISAKIFDVRTLNEILQNHRDHEAVLIELRRAPSDEKSSLSVESPTVKALAQTCSSAAQSRVVQAKRTSNPDLLRLITLIGACESVHSRMLATHV